MKVIIPIVGSDNIGRNTDYILSLYEIERKTVFQYICDFLSTIENAEFIVILRRRDIMRYHFDQIVRLLIPDVTIVVADGDTKGSACSCLLAIDHLDLDEPLVICSSNQLFNDDPAKIMNYFTEYDYDGGIVIFEDIHPKYSYVRLDEDDLVVEAAEKRPISKNATAGFYYFKRAGDFVDGAINMIMKKDAVNDRYYLCPIYNELILKQRRVGVYRIDRKDYFLFKEQEGIDAYRMLLREGKSDD